MAFTGKKELVVIGNGMAGAAFLEEVSRLEHRYNITLFGKEEYPRYNRVLLAEVLSGKKSLEEITINNFDWHRERGIKLLAGCEVKRIDRAKKAVIADGAAVRYDRLVIATGSVPLRPQIKGIEKEGVVFFRNMADCLRLKKAVEGSKRAVVLGGGFVGLETAHALRELGLSVTVVHLMNKLMERNLDSRASGFLKEDLERMGIEVMLEKQTAEVMGEKEVAGLKFRDGSAVECDIIVCSTGIRPNIALASEAGIYCRRGIVVSDTMQTYDPSIYAVGECTENRGETFALVSHVFEQAKVLANQLAGDSRLTFKKKPVSVKLKVPGIELYSAGEISEDAEAIEYIDGKERIYKRIFLKGARISGILMYGDAAESARLFTHLAQEEDIAEKRRNLLLPSPQKLAQSVSALPDSTIICGCNGVTKKTIVEAIETKGLFTREDVAASTKASSSCGGCSALVEQILETVLGSNFRDRKKTRGICPCTKYTRDDIIKNIREKKLLSVSAVMETLGWETVGCEACRPALNYYISAVWPLLAQDDPTSRVANERMHANLQKDGTFSVVPRMYGGLRAQRNCERLPMRRRNTRHLS
jgi:nitrite reductase (NADH) large subunit